MIRVLTKKSVVTGTTPASADLLPGELAINTADAVLYTKHGDNSIRRVGTYVHIGSTPPTDTERLWLDTSTSGTEFMSGAKSSAVDAGVFGQISITDDYLYVCVQTGVAGSAIWKKSLISQT